METLRQTGIDALGDCRWGTHFCLFCHTPEDLIDIQVPYLKAGLESNEFCMWVTSAPLGVEEAKSALAAAVAHWKDYIGQGQIEILDYSQWYARSDGFEAERMLQGWIEKEQEVTKKGWQGLRVTADTFWLQKENWRAFADYEAMVDHAIGQQRMIALCAYSLDKCGSSEILDVVSNHHFALIRREGNWERIEGAERKQAEETVRASERRLRALLANSADGISLLDAEGVLIYDSLAAPGLLGYAPDELVGRNVFGFIHPDDLPEVRSLFAQLVQQPGSRRAVEFRYWHKNGTWRWLDGVGSNLLNDRSVQAIVVNYRDVTERKRREYELEAVVTLRAALRNAATYTDMLPILLDRTLDLLCMDGASLVLCKSATGEIVIELGRGAWAHHTGVRLSPGEGLIGSALTSGQPYQHSDVQSDSRFYRPDLLSGTRATACVPLIAQGETLGALWVGRRSAGEAPHPPSSDLSQTEMRLLTAIADVAANAIRRASLHERTLQLSGQLESRERLIRRILDSIPSSLLVIDRALQIASVNRNFLEKARRGAPATLRQKIEDVFPQVLMEYTRLDQKVLEVFRSGRAIEGGKVAYRAPGLPTRIYYYRLVPLFVSPTREDGAVESVMLLMDDITEREQLGEEVRRAERHLASVVECANDLVVSLDSQGRIVTWNRAAERASGLSAERALGQSLSSLCVGEHRPAMAETLLRLIRGEGVENTEVDLLTAVGEAVPIAWSFSPMRDDAGEVTGIVAVGRDLTERRRLEAQLIQTAKMASLGVMAGGIAHELRNPLGIISATAQLLLMQPRDKQLHDDGAHKIHTATQRASLIIENLLKFARPQNERMRVIDLRLVLEETFALLTHQIALHQVTLNKEIRPDLPEVYGNPGLLQQVFTNLILNACNAMSEGGSLTVTAQAAGAERAAIRFRDTGRGIAPEHLPKVFDPFFTTMPAGQGTGLGLSISYSIIQQHQGSIEVESQLGRGSTFTIWLPRAQAGLAGESEVGRRPDTV